MRVTRLEIFGFKSFVERFVLNFDVNAIGIVGPNGCGKSNIVDSLRWVLGETQAKQLRGNLFDDLIFNGSESRRPLGMAEVSITIRPNDGWAQLAKAQSEQNNLLTIEKSNDDDSIQEIEIDEDLELSVSDEELKESEEPSDEAIKLAEIKTASSIADIPGVFEAAEIELTRRLYRSGESEFFINKTACRLKDLIEIYRLIGLGARGLSIVQQGQVGQIISKKPLERRQILEEAAGISGFRTRIDTAEKKLEKTSENMARLQDIILEIEKQLKVLRKQAKRAKNRQELKEKLKTAEVDQYLYKSAQIYQKLSQGKDEQGTLSNKVQEGKSDLEVILASEEKLRSELAEVDVRLSDVRAKKDALSARLIDEREKDSELKLRQAELSNELRLIKESLSELREDVGKREIKEAQIISSTSDLEISLNSLASGLDPLYRELEEISKNSTFSKASDPKAQSAIFKATLENIEKQLSPLAKEVKKLIEKVRSELSSGSDLVAKDSLESCQKFLESLTASFSNIDKELFSLRRERELRDEISSIHNQKVGVESELNFERNNLDVVKNELSFLSKKLSNTEEREKNLLVEFKGVTSQISSKSPEEEKEEEVQRYQISKEFEALQEEEARITREKNQVQLKYQEVSTRLDKIKKEISILSEREAEKRLFVERCDIELEMIERETRKSLKSLMTQSSSFYLDEDDGVMLNAIESINNKFGDTENFESSINDENSDIVEETKKEEEISLLLPAKEQILLASTDDNLESLVRNAEQLCNSLRRKLEREGEVDPQSITLCEQEEKRLDSMQKQYSDLSQAKDILTATVKRLREVSKDRFTETFKNVSEKFAELVPRLFGGGAGALTLTNVDDPLNSGVDISVKPPGKKLRNLELMSGGEKALSAAALLVAMFLNKPSPICVLDEVDAPLDDANLSRFLDVIGEISKTTQFLVITHNKQTMAFADRLIGITMQEPGVSTPLSVSLEQAEQTILEEVSRASAA